MSQLTNNIIAKIYLNVKKKTKKHKNIPTGSIEPVG